MNKIHLTKFRNGHAHVGLSNVAMALKILRGGSPMMMQTEKNARGVFVCTKLDEFVPK